MHFMTKLLHGTVDEVVHRAFLRYGRGEYDGPAAEISLSKAGKVKIRSTFRYQDLVATKFVQCVPDETIQISGLILGPETLNDALANLEISAPPIKKKPKTKLFQTKFSGEYSTNQLYSLYNEVGEEAYIFCSLSASGGWTHKSKTALPSAQKESPIHDQLKFSTTRIPTGTGFISELLQELAPDFIDMIPDSFTLLRLENRYAINELVFPPDREGLSSVEIRLKTKRKGVLQRKLFLDEKVYNKEHPFSA